MKILNEFVGSNIDYLVPNMYPYIADIALFFNKVGKPLSVVTSLSFYILHSLVENIFKVFITLKLDETHTHTHIHMGQVMELWQSCYLVLLSTDSKMYERNLRKMPQIWYQYGLLYMGF